MLQAGRSRGVVIEYFSVSNSFSRTMVLGLTQPLTKMSTRKSFWYHLRDDFQQNVGSSTFLNPIGLTAFYRDSCTGLLASLFRRYLEVCVVRCDCIVTIQHDFLPERGQLCLYWTEKQYSGLVKFRLRLLLLQQLYVLHNPLWRLWKVPFVSFLKPPPPPPPSRRM
jgi:hypothetical protein